MRAMSPQDEYRARLERWTQMQGGLRQRLRQLGNAGLATGVAALLIAAGSLGAQWISPWWLLLPLVVFAVLATYHESVDRSLTRASRAAAYYDRAMARVENRWIGTGSQGVPFTNPWHVYADDLDVF